MTIQPHLNLLSALAPATTAPTISVASLATQNLRFDAALLQAAKVVRDGSDSQGLGQALTPKVEEALKSLFSQLAQKPADQLQQWAKQPDLLKPTVDAIAQAQGLDTQETAELKSLAPMATENLIQALNGTKLAPVDTAKLEQPGTISGPQGGEPGTPVDPATSFKPAPAAAAPPEAPPITTATVSSPKTTAVDSSALADVMTAPVAPVTHKQDASTALQTSLAQAMVWAGTLVSSRTDDGSRSDSTLSLAARSASSAAPVAEASSVKISTMQPLQIPQDAAKGTEAGPAASTTQATVRPQAPVTTVMINGVPVKTQPSAGSTLSEDSAPSAAPAAASVSLQAVATQRSLSPEVQAAPVSDSPAPVAPAPVRNQAGPVASAPKSATEQSLDFKIAALPSDTPATPIQDGSLFVLKGDGSTQGTTQVQSPQEPAVAVQVQPLAQQTQAAASPAPSLPSAVQAAAPQPAGTQAPVSSVQPIAPAFTPSAPVLAQAPATAPMAPQQAPAPAAAAVVVTQAPAAVAAPVVAAALQAPLQAQTTVQQPSGASPKAEAAPAAAENTRPLAPEPQVQENSVGFQALKHSSPEEAGQPGFSFGQDTLRSLVSQVSRQAGVRDAAFTQVTDALVDSAVKETSRLIINLKPANLGQVQVDLSVEGGKVTARLIASTPEVRDAFVRDLPAFKASLEAQGLRIDQVAVAVRGEGNLNAQSQNQGQPRNPWANAVVMPQNGALAAGVVAPSAWAPAPGADTLFSALA